MKPALNRSPRARSLRWSLGWSLALWMGLVALSPALSWAETPTDEAPLAGPDDVAPDAQAVTDEGEIKQILDNLTIYGRYVDGENWIEYHLPDGRTAYWEKGCTYPGKWWLQNGQVCYAYPNYHDNAANCFILYHRPNGEIQFAAIADAGFSYLASFSLKTATGNDAALPIGALSPCVGA
jgi:hypothetical protein